MGLCWHSKLPLLRHVPAEDPHASCAVHAGRSSAGEPLRRESDARVMSHVRNACTGSTGRHPIDTLTGHPVLAVRRARRRCAPRPVSGRARASRGWMPSGSPQRARLMDSGEGAGRVLRYSWKALSALRAALCRSSDPASTLRTWSVPTSSAACRCPDQQHPRSCTC